MTVKEFSNKLLKALSDTPEIENTILKDITVYAKHETEGVIIVWLDSEPRTQADLQRPVSYRLSIDFNSPEI